MCNHKIIQWEACIPGTCHEVLQDKIARVGCLHLAVNVFEHSSDELNDGNDETAKCNRSQMVPTVTQKAGYIGFTDLP